MAGSFGLGVDEAHYVLYAKNLDFSYFDHPPLVGWTHALFLLFGDNELFARLPAILIGILSSFLVYYFVLNLSSNKSIALFSVIALNSSPMINALFMMLLPDTFLIPIVFLLLFLLKKMQEAPKNWHYSAGGVLFGIAGLAKYSSFLLTVASILYLIYKKRFDLIFTPRLFLTLFIALAFISPVIYWNFLHDFVSFKYQSNHVIGSSFDFISFLKSFLAQFGAYSPLLFILSIIGLYKAFKQKEGSLKAALFMGLSIAIFFIYTSLTKVVLPHWSAIFYALFIPISIYLFWHQKRLICSFVTISMLITLFLYIELLFKNIPSLHKEIYGWQEIMQKANILIKDHKNMALAVPNWTLGSRAIYYDKGRNEVFVIDDRIDQFDFWQKTRYENMDLLFIIPKSFKIDIKKRVKCSEYEFIDKMEIRLKNVAIEEIEFILCKR